MKARCLHCGNEPKRSFYKYCSNKCQANFQYNKYILDWQTGSKDGGRGIVTRNISRHIKRYLIEKYGESCSSCEWALKHPTTGRVPLEVDHLDGNGENNNENNLRLLCPNCHSLTLTFRNLNKGKGREWRKKKYSILD